jgi:hypothetical protein
MRQFSVRWWSGPNLQLWRSGQYPHPFAFFPHIDYERYPVNDPRILGPAPTPVDLACRGEITFSEAIDQYLTASPEFHRNMSYLLAHEQDAVMCNRHVPYGIDAL